MSHEQIVARALIKRIQLVQLGLVSSDHNDEQTYRITNQKSHFFSVISIRDWLLLYIFRYSAVMRSMIWSTQSNAGPPCFDSRKNTFDHCD